MILALTFLLEQSVHASDQGDKGVWSEPKRSWALGLVLPEEARLEGGVALRWSRVSNITAVVSLPNITHTDNTIYLALSAMTDRGEVMQVTAGINRADSEWYAYVFYIEDITRYPQLYMWLANRSEPKMGAGDKVALSLILGSGGLWEYVVHNLVSGLKSSGTMPTARPLKAGEQEVFAFESYTSSPGVFREMGEAVLEAIYIDGLRLESGGYVIGGWDPTRRPLFIVGGRDPPSFITVIQSSSRCIWRYSEGKEWIPTPGWLQSIFYLLSLVFSIVLTVILLRRK